MAVLYPDILNDLLDARERYEADGVQFMVALESDHVAAGQAVTVILHLQNVIDQPVKLYVVPAPPTTGFLKRTPSGVKFETSTPPPMIEMGPGEVGVWRVPLLVPVASPIRGVTDLPLTFRANGDRGQRVRLAKSQHPAGQTVALLEDLVGYRVVPVIGSNYESKDGHKVTLKITVGDPALEVPAPTLGAQWTLIWSPVEIANFHVTVREVNSRRVHLVDELGKPELFKRMLSVAHTRLSGSNLLPHEGEELAFAKILTYTVGAFMHDEETQNALLVPAFYDSMVGGRSVNDVTDVLCGSGFQHLLRLTIGLSFNAIAKAAGRQPWSVEERRGVVAWVSDCLSHQQPMPDEFMYIPLMLGALTIMPVRMSPDENVIESFKELGYAWQARLPGFKTDPDLQEMVTLFDLIARSTVAKLATRPGS